MFPRLIAFKRKKSNTIEIGHLTFDKQYCGGAKIQPLNKKEQLSIEYIKWLTKL